jgi:chromosome segregation ATPase
MVGLSAVGAGCEKHEPAAVAGKEPTRGEEVEKKVAEAADAAADYAKQKKDEYVAWVQRAVDEARREIDKLRAEAAEARASAKRALERQIKSSERKLEVAERKLKELQSASGQAWKDLKSGVDRAVDDLKPSAGRKNAHASPATH